MTRAYIARMTGGGMQKADVQAALQCLGGQELVPPGARVFIKPNLTWPEHLPGVTTTPQAIESVVAALRELTPHVIVGESDGGYHAYQAEDAFRGHGLYDLEKGYGAKIVNLSRLPVERVSATVAGRQVEVMLPQLLLHEIDLFVTLPVPKVHVMTGVSLAFKNQWGCLTSPMRLREHPEFDHKIVAINQLVGTRLAIFDGTYFLDQTGPMFGEPVSMDLLLAGDSPGAASALCCAVMGIDPATIRHLRLARRVGMWPESLADVALNADLGPFLGRKFTMKRAFLDWLSLIGFRSRLFATLFWDSAAAGPLHSLLYAVRRNPRICRFLYGPAGSPPEWQPGAEQDTA